MMHRIDLREEGGRTMRRMITVLVVVVVGVVAGGLTSAIAATGIAQEETVVFGERTLKAKVLDLAGKPDDFVPGDRYLFRSRLTQGSTTAGALYVDCSVHFGKHDTCTQVYDVQGRGTVVATGIIPVAQLDVGGTWTLAITGGTGEFENVGGSVAVEIVNQEGDSQHTLHLLP
jgi:hypothetical protein